MANGLIGFVRDVLSRHSGVRRAVPAALATALLASVSLAAIALPPTRAEAYQTHTSGWTVPSTGVNTTGTNTLASGLTITLAVAGPYQRITSSSWPPSNRGATSAMFQPPVPTSTQFIAFATDGTGCAAGKACDNRGTVTVTFSQPVRNPVIHVAGIGAAFAPNYSQAQHNLTSSVPAGATLGAASSGSTNLVVNNGNQIDVIQRSASTYCNSLQNAALYLAGCGSVPVVGTVTSLTFTMSLPSVQGPNNPATAIQNDDYMFGVSVDEDYGDAPATYEQGNAATHVAGDLTIGSGVTVDNANVQNTGSGAVSPNASADASRDADDMPPPADAFAGQAYTLDVPLSGVSRSGIVCGWIDVGRNGTFDTAERACGTFAADATSVRLAWPATAIPSTATLGSTFLRVRADYGASATLNPNGPLDSGEVEDWPIVVRGPLTYAKTLAQAPTPVAGSPGVYETRYELRVVNPNPTAVSYAITDQLAYGAGTTIVSTSSVNTTPGTLTGGTGWNGADQTAATGTQSIAGGNTAHVWTVTVRATLNLSQVTAASSDCTMAAGETGTGAWNNSTLVAGAQSTSSSACAPFPAVTQVKRLVSANPAGNGDWDLAYDVVVSNGGSASGTYTLDDRFTFGQGITVKSQSVTTTAAGVTPSATWNGAANVNVVTSQLLAAGSTHTFRVTARATAPLSAPSAASTDCALDSGETGTGFLNQSTLTVAGQAFPASACAPSTSITIAKAVTGQPVPVAGQPGVYDMKYELSVTNSGAAAGTYNLTDVLKPGTGISVVSASAANTAPGTLTGTANWNGQAQPSVASGIAIAAGPVTHVWTLTVRYRMDVATTTAASADCTLAPGETGTGTRNEGTVTSNGQSATANACAALPAITHSKYLVTSNPNGDGTYTLTYNVVVTNSGGASGTYTLDDQFRFGAGITISARSVITTAAGVTPSASWNGAGTTRIVTDQALAAGASHTYQVTVTAAVPLTAPNANATNCHLDPGETGTGFLNEATLATAGQSTVRDACTTTPSVAITKTVSAQPAPVAGQPGTFELKYEVKVVNSGTGTVTYNLTDALKFGTGITVVSAAVTAPGSAAWNGQAQQAVATAASLTGGSSQAWTVTVRYRLDQATVTAASANCTLDASETGTGTRNETTLTVNGQQASASACAPVTLPAISHTKRLVSVTPAGGGNQTAVYELVVTNTGADGRYTLDDRLRFGDGISVAAARVTTSPAGVTPSPAWDGGTDPRIVTDQALAAGATHTYQITVTAAVPLSATSTATDCTVDSGESGTGLLNQSTLTAFGPAETRTACAPTPSIAITKRVSAEPVPVAGQPGVYQVSYQLSATNSGAGAGTYDLVDVLRYGTGVSVVSASAANTTPGTLTGTAGWNGRTQTTVATGQALAAGTSHVWTVTVQFRVDPAQATAASTDCSVAAGEQGTGTRNETTIISNGLTASADACAEVPSISHTKRLVSATPAGNGTYTVLYDIDVTNSGTAAGTYTLDDQLAFGAGITVSSAAVSSSTSGVSPSPAWNGTGDQRVIAGKLITGGATHTFRVTVTAQVPLSLAAAATNCTVDSGESGTGFRNTSTLSTAGQQVTQSACGPVPSIEITKTVAAQPAPVAGQPGVFDIQYQLRVVNSGAGSGTYDLADVLRYGTGIAVQSASVANTTPGTLTPAAGWNGQSQATIVSGGAIAAGESHVWTVTARYRIDQSIITAASADCTLDDSESGTGTRNETALTANGLTAPDDACAPVALPAISHTKRLVSATPAGAGQQTVVYEVTVTNGGAAGTYTLDDQLRFGQGITVVSQSATTTAAGVTPSASWNGSTGTRIVTSQPIDAGATHTFTITATASVPLSGVPDRATDCTLDIGEAGTGLLNQSTMTAVGPAQTRTACAPVSSLTITKRVTSAPVAVPDQPGVYVIGYTIEVANTGAGATTYDLTDTLRLGAGLTVVETRAENTTPGTLTATPGWNGRTQTTVATGAAIDAEDVHTWSVLVRYSVDTSVATDASTDCTLAAGETGTGTRNEATVISNGLTEDANACAETASIVHVKRLTSVTPAGNGTYTVTYEVAVRNAGSAEGEYSLDDQLRFGQGITVRSRSVATSAPGVTPSPDWNGAASQRIVTGQAIDGGVTHTYQITVTADVPPAMASGDTNCTLSPGQAGTGFLNVATLTVAGRPSAQTDCATVPSIALTKAVSAQPVPVAGQPGVYDIQYEVRVVNSGYGAGGYDLADVLRYGTGVSVVSASVSAPATTPLPPGSGTWNGQAQPVVASGHAIPGRTSQVWTVSVRYRIDQSVITTTAANCTLDAGETGTGTRNEATLTTNGHTLTANDCAPVALPAVSHTKRVVSVTPAGGGRQTVVYQIVVTNTGAAGLYTLDDQLRFGAGIAVSGAQVTTSAAGVTPSGTWNGGSDIRVVTNQPIAAGASHTYQVTATAAVPLATTGALADCVLDSGENGTGLLNQSTMTAVGPAQTRTACAPTPSIAFTKSISAQPAPVAGQPGVYQMTYALRVANAGAGAGTYDLVDTLKFGTGVTVLSALVTNTAPGTLPPVPGWNGTTQTAVSTGTALGAATAHVWTVTVQYRVDTSTATQTSTDCTLSSGESGTGTLNEATLISNGLTTDANACAATPAISHTKRLVSATPAGNGTYALAYELTVTNAGAGSGSYTLDDQLRFGTGITVQSRSVSAGTAGVTPSPAWNGATDQRIVTDQPIAGATTHTYQITATVAVPQSMTAASTDCTLAAGESGTGFLNASALTVAGQVTNGSACAPAPSIALTKTITKQPAVVPGQPGVRELTYELRVTNSGAGAGTYDLSDTLRYGTGLAVLSAAVANTVPGSLTPAAGWNGGAQPVIATGQALAPGTGHTWTVTVRFGVDQATATPASTDCTVDSGETGTGTRNEAVLVSNGQTASAAACAPVAAISHTKRLVSAAPAGNGTWAVSYEVVVTNRGAGAGDYTLDDTFQFGAGITVRGNPALTGGVAPSVSWNGAGDTRIVTDQALAGGAEHRYQITATVLVPLTAPTSQSTNCTLEPGETGTGLLNSATLATDAGTATATACEQTPSFEYAKLVSAGPTPVAGSPDTFNLTYELRVQNNGAAGGTYDLADRLTYGTGVAVQPAPAVVNTTPGGLTPVAGWNGTGQQQVVTGQPLAAGALHVWTVTVRYTVDKATITAASADCALAAGESGTGTRNVMTLTINGTQFTKDACVPVTAVGTTKTTVSAAPSGNGQWTVVYDVTVTNGGAATTYSLDDRLRYDPAITIVSATVTAPAGVTASPAWNGRDQATLVTGQEIPASTTHTYRVTIIAAVPASSPARTATDCTLDAGETGTGLMNEATTTTAGGTEIHRACRETPSVTFGKVITEPPAPVAGGYQVTYELRVANDGAGEGTYDLTDTLRFGTGVTITSATAANTTPGSLTVNPAWNGRAVPGIVAGQLIEAGTRHTWTITVWYTVDSTATVTATDCALDAGESGTGTRNDARLTINGLPLDQSACAPVAAVTLSKTIASDTPGTDGRRVLVYDLVAANRGSAAALYTLDDSLRFGQGITVESAAVSASPAGVTVNPAWSGTGNLVTGQSLPGGTQHTYRITVTARVPASVPDPTSTDCALSAGETGTGLLNQATLTTDGRTLGSEACAPTPSLSLSKTSEGIVRVAGADDTYDVTYTVAVVNGGAGAGAYDLADRPRFGTGLTILSAQAPGSEPGWNGTSQPALATARPIAAGATHRWTVTVRLKADPATVTGPALDCALDAGEPGTGTRNEAALTTSGATLTQQACEPIGIIVQDPKTLVSMTPRGNGNVELVYELTVRNVGAAGTYTLTDQLRYGQGITISAVAVTTTPAGVTTAPDFDGTTQPRIVTDQAIAASTTHVYRVTVTANIPISAAAGSTDCELTGSETGTGLLNSATLTSATRTDTRSVCRPTPSLAFTKTAGTPVPVAGQDDTFDLTYDLAISNSGAGDGSYDLADRLRFGAGVQIQPAPAIANVTPGGLAVTPGWDGNAQPAVTTAQPIAAGTSHVWRVTVRYKADPATITATSGDCTLATGETGTGTRNDATLTVNGSTVDASACRPVGTIVVDPKRIVSSSPKGDGTYEIVYELAVSNPGGGPVPYDASDRLRFGAGITVNSAAITTGPGGVAWNRRWNGTTDTTIGTALPLPAGTTHTYRMTVVATIPTTAPDTAATDCTLAAGEPGTGLLNEASVTRDGRTTTTSACAPTPSFAFAKRVTSEPASVGGGNYEVRYEITVSNTGAGAGIYALADKLAFGPGAAITAATATPPAGVTPSPGGWNGQGQPILANNQVLAAGTVHLWAITVTLRQGSGTVQASTTDCTLDPGETGTGTLNIATLTVNGRTDRQDACAPYPFITIAKKPVSVTPLAASPGLHEIVYEIAVINLGTAAGAYGVDDTLAYGAGVTIQSAAVTGKPDGVTTRPDWNGVTQSQIATGQAIPGRTTHVYQVTVRASLPAGLPPKVTDCTLDPGERGTGLLNRAALTGDLQQVSEACAPLPSIAVTKRHTGTRPVPGVADTHDVTYEIEVANRGAGPGNYLVADELTYGTGVQIVSATVDGPASPDPAWDGRTVLTIAKRVAISPAARHVWTVSVRIKTPAAIDPRAADCTLDDGESGTGLRNRATAALNGIPLHSEACAMPPPPAPRPVPPGPAPVPGPIPVTGSRPLLLLTAGGMAVLAGAIMLVLAGWVRRETVR